MPTSAKYAGVRRNVGGFKHLDQFAGGPRSAMQEFLYFQARRDVVERFWDFTELALDTTNDWTTNGGTGSTVFAIPSTKLVGGAITGATGTNGTESNRCVNLYNDPIWSGDKNAGVEFRFKIGAAVTDIEFACGFIDTHATITTAVPLFGDVDTPTLATGIGDAALVGMDTAQTLTTLALVTLGSTPYSAAKTNIGTIAPTAATYFTIRIQLIGDTVIAQVDDATANNTVVTKASGIEGGVLVRPIFTISGPTATTKTFDIDYIRCWQDR